MELNNRYIRRSPDGDESVIIIKTEEERKYHEDLEAEGFVYKEVVVHNMKESCPSCEG